MMKNLKYGSMVKDFLAAKFNSDSQNYLVSYQVILTMISLMMLAASSPLSAALLKCR